MPESTLRAFLGGRSRTMTLEKLDKLAKAAGVTLGELLGETGKIVTDDQSAFVAVKHLEVHAAAGGGFTVEQEPEGKPFHFRKDWLEHKFGGHDGKLRIIHFDGDSMLPTIHSGDVGLILTGLEKDDLRSGHIYVLWDGNGLVVKRLETVLGDRPRLRVISDNRALYAPYEIDAENARIVGRVLWRGGDL